MKIQNKMLAYFDFLQQHFLTALYMALIFFLHALLPQCRAEQSITTWSGSIIAKLYHTTTTLPPSDYFFYQSRVEQSLISRSGYIIG